MLHYLLVTIPNRLTVSFIIDPATDVLNLFRLMSNGLIESFFILKIKSFERVYNFSIFKASPPKEK